jgi:hypothetical protein
MNDSVLIWEKYTSLHEANLISKDPLHLELEKILKEKNVQKPEIVNWFLKTYIKWFQSPADDNQKTQFVSNYQAKETDPEWAKREGIVQFNSFTPEYKDRLSHLVDFLNTKDEFYLKSLFKVTVPQMFEEVQKWDQEMERSSEKAKKAKIQSVEGVDYRVDGVYDGYPVWKLTSNKSFREESMYMGHCVGQAEGESKVTSVEGGESEYFRQFKQGEMIIFSLRDPKEHNQPAVTFELNKVYGEKTFKIVQIKGPANREVSERYRKACRKFIEDKEFVVKEDGENIGMVKWSGNISTPWSGNFYFEDSEKFKNIYQTEIVPKQKQKISEIMSYVKNGKILENVFLNNLFLKELPDLSNILVEGDFDCSDNQLTTLEGSPREVYGIFSCHNNKLTSLKGAPQEAHSNFDCSVNQLITLEGAPSTEYEYFYGNFNCDRNKLTTLKGAPQKVRGYFNCSNNELTTLEGAPQVVRKSFYCFDNKLTTLKGAPRRVDEYFNCENNKLTTLEGAPEEIGGSFYSSGNPVEFTEQDIEEAQERSRQRNQPKLESFKHFFSEACWKTTNK